jgi:ABC-type sulfate transport system permease subunit
VSRRTVEFGCAIVVIGMLAGAATTLLLHAVEHLTCHYSFGTLLVASAAAVRFSNMR